MVGAGILVCLAITITIYRPWDLQDGFMIGAPVGRDFANLWFGGHLAAQGRFDLLIDLANYNAAFSQFFAHNPAETFVFSYPPHMLLLLAPLGMLPFAAAAWIWTAINLLCISLATRLISQDKSALWAALLSPAVLTMVAFGHFGGMLALAAIFILLRGNAQPVLSGLCLALATVKPQFAITLSIVLLFTGYWRAILWSVPFGVALLALSLAAFGTQPWIDFVQWTIPFHARLIGGFHIEAMPTIVSVYTAAGMLGAPVWLAQALQYVFAAVVLVSAIARLRRHGPDAPTLAVVLLAVLLVLPYVNSYDLAIVMPALAAALWRSRPEKPFLPCSRAVILWLIPAFALPLGLAGWPLAPLCVAGVLGALIFQSGPFGRMPSLTPVKPRTIP